MIVLALDSSAKAASACVCELDGAREKVLSLCYQNAGLTHSQTLLPMAKQAITSSGLTLNDIELLAVTQGPGSFTGIRIGIATALGLSFGGRLPSVGVSTLEAASQPFRGAAGVICACMDARREQVYTALFWAGEGGLERLCPDRAIALSELEDELAGYHCPVLFCGDGGELAYNHSRHPHKKLAPEPVRHQNAYGAARAGYEKFLAQGADAQLRPDYLRPVHISERKR